MNRSVALIVGCLTTALMCVDPAMVVAQERQEGSGPPPAEMAFEPQGFLREPDAIERAAVFAERHAGNELKNGFYTNFGNLVPGAGWLSVGPGYKRWFERDRAFVDASATVSWHWYKAAQARFELPRIARSRLALGSQVQLQDFTQVDFFGEGPESLEVNGSEYRLRSGDLVGYATWRPIKSVGITGQLGWLNASILPRAGIFKSDRPDTNDLFPNDIVFALPDQPTFVHSEASVTADTRDFPLHPLRGGLLRVAASRYSDRASGVLSFTRYEAEAARFVPLAGSRIVLALHGWLAASTTDPGRFVPFYLQPSLGGRNTLRSYPDYRFHDRNLLVVNVETRVAAMTHIDVAAFLDAGAVAPHLDGLNLDKRSYGAGLRFHSRRETFARLDVARGAEGWRILFGLSDPLSLTRVSRRTAAVPVAP